MFFFRKSIFIVGYAREKDVIYNVVIVFDLFIAFAWKMESTSMISTCAIYVPIHRKEMSKVMSNIYCFCQSVFDSFHIFRAEHVKMIPMLVEFLLRIEIVSILHKPASFPIIKITELFHIFGTYESIVARNVIEYQKID